MRRERRTYTAEFKLQLVKLYANGKSRAEIIKEYELTPSAFDKWVRQHQSNGSFWSVYTYLDRKIKVTYT